MVARRPPTVIDTQAKVLGSSMSLLDTPVDVVTCTNSFIRSQDGLIVLLRCRSLRHGFLLDVLFLSSRAAVVPSTERPIYQHRQYVAAGTTQVRSIAKLVGHANIPLLLGLPSGMSEK